MMKKLGFFILASLLLSCSNGEDGVIYSPPKTIVILSENDVHCEVDGYAHLAAYRDVIDNSDTAYVGIVSAGDFVQGGLIGSLSEGDWIIDIMNSVKYDAVTLGNHEFDYKIPRMQKLFAKFNGGVTCINLKDCKTGKILYPSYIMKYYGPTKIAFIGVATPTTITSEEFAFVDENKNKLYDLIDGKELFSIVNEAAQKARNEGADYVIVLSHLGDDTPGGVTSYEFATKTKGIDAIIDGHTHHVIDVDTINSEGKKIHILQTGKKFENIGKLTITTSGNIITDIIPTSAIHYASVEVVSVVNDILQKCENITNKVIGKSEVDLIARTEESETEWVRIQETNAGDFAADAYRITMDADIGIINGGAFRSNLMKGVVNYGDLIKMTPYGNEMYLLRVKGDTLEQAIGKAVSHLPAKSGSFFQVSGIKYTIKVNQPNSANTVSNIQVLDKTTGNYKNWASTDYYELATNKYVFETDNDGIFKDCEVLKETSIHDYDYVRQYLEVNLGGLIKASDYGNPLPTDRIKIE